MTKYIGSYEIIMQEHQSPIEASNLQEAYDKLSQMPMSDYQIEEPIKLLLTEIHTEEDDTVWESGYTIHHGLDDNICDQCNDCIMERHSTGGNEDFAFIYRCPNCGHAYAD